MSSLRRRSSCYNIQRAEQRDRRNSSKFECAWIPWKYLWINSESTYLYLAWWICFCSVSEDCWDEAVFFVAVLGWRVQACNPSAPRQLAEPQPFHISLQGESHFAIRSTYSCEGRDMEVESADAFPRIYIFNSPAWYVAEGILTQWTRNLVCKVIFIWISNQWLYLF